MPWKVTACRQTLCDHEFAICSLSWPKSQLGADWANTAGSKASASIETDRQQFDKLADDLGIYASALSIAADRNPDTLGPGTRMKGGEAMMGGPLAKKMDAAREAESMPAEHAFHLMLQTCTSCHAKFRIEGK